MDRVHRLGQTRDVVITKFYREGAIENWMLQTQGMKKELAELSMQKGAVGRAEAARNRWRELGQMFKGMR